MYCAVAEKEGLILGWACAFHHYEQPEGLYNLGVFVAPPYRNQRIGSTVLATIVRTLHKGRFYFDPGTEEQNPLGRKLYMPYKGDPRFYTRPSVAL
jgi:GNAT superfamily N-acetyltransferase